jgi:GDPmannose 4,6-dehydratase
MCVNYREAYGIFAANGIHFNHETPRRGPTYVTRKITRAVARIAKGLQSCIHLGNLDAKRDWGHAEDYVEAMWLMLQQEKPDDFVIGTGETHSVREFINAALEHMGVKYEWRGSTIDEECVCLDGGNPIIKINPDFYRPAEVDVLIADSRKAYEVLNWRPKTTFEQLVKRMVDKDVNN